MTSSENTSKVVGCMTIENAGSRVADSNLKNRKRIFLLLQSSNQSELELRLCHVKNGAINGEFRGFISNSSIEETATILNTSVQSVLDDCKRAFNGNSEYEIDLTELDEKRIKVEWNKNALSAACQLQLGSCELYALTKDESIADVIDILVNGLSELFERENKNLTRTRALEEENLGLLKVCWYFFILEKPF
ncbi:hypothetical protein ACOME3_000775 [Neoechinorhynchus agilis]